MEEVRAGGGAHVVVEVDARWMIRFRWLACVPTRVADVYTYAHGVVLATGLEEGLVDTATAGGHTDGRTSARRDGLLRTRGETNTGLAVLRVADDGGVVARGASKGSTVTDLLLDVEDDGTLRAGREGENVADRKGSLLAGVDERAGRDTLRGDEGLLAELVAVRVTEDDGREGSTTAR